MSILNNPDFLRQVIINVAEEAYQYTVEEMGIEDDIIGPSLDYENKKQWIQEWIEDRFDAVKKKMLSFTSKTDSSKLSDIMELSIKIYSLDICETMEVNQFISITRVPGGWIYSSKNPNTTSQTFVPFNNEFQVDLRGIDEAL